MKQPIVVYAGVDRKKVQVHYYDVNATSYSFLDGDEYSCIMVYMAEMIKDGAPVHTAKTCCVV